MTCGSSASDRGSATMSALRPLGLLRTLTGGNDSWMTPPPWATSRGPCGSASRSSGTSTSSSSCGAWRRSEVRTGLPFLIVVFLALMGWMIVSAGGFGQSCGIRHPGLGRGLLEDLPAVPHGHDRVLVHLSLNMPDFTRFGRSQREQAISQTLGLRRR